MDYDMDVSENGVKMMINHWIEAYTIVRQTHIPNYILVSIIRYNYNYQPTWGWNIALMKISLVYDMCRFEEKPFEGYPSF